MTTKDDSDIKICRNVVAQRIVHGSVQHLQLLLGPVVVTILSIVDESFIILACP